MSTCHPNAPSQKRYAALLKAAQHVRFYLREEKSRRGTTGRMRLDELLEELDYVIAAAEAGGEKP